MNLPESVQNVVGRVGNGFRRLINWLGETTTAPESALPSVYTKVDQQKEEPKSVARLAPYQRGIRVQCVSCGVLHDLEAVCHRCGEPLCDDTKHCRHSLLLSHLETTVVVCPTCYSDVRAML